MNLTSRTSDGGRLVRSNKIQLPQELLDSADQSYDTGSARVIGGFVSEQEANRTFTKLRAYLNANDRGLRASKPFKDDDGSFAMEFSVKDKRVFTPKTQ